MSATTGRLLPTLSPSFWVSSSLSVRRPASTTVKPAFISASDAARPTPDPAPVTTAILFFASAMDVPPFYGSVMLLVATRLEPRFSIRQEPIAHRDYVAARVV